MRLYSVDENYFETMDELLEYCRQNKISTKNLTTLDYYREFYDCKDVIRKTSSEVSIFYAALNEQEYVWYCDEANINRENWEFNHGNIRTLYKPFRNRGIVFEEDIYAISSEKNRHILNYCNKNNLFNTDKKDK